MDGTKDGWLCRWNDTVDKCVYIDICKDGMLNLWMVCTLIVGKMDRWIEQKMDDGWME